MKRLLPFILIFTSVFNHCLANSAFLDEIVKAGTVVNTYESVSCREVDFTSDLEFKEQWKSICNVVVNSELCKDIEKEDLLSCNDSDENSLNVKSFKFIKNCGIGFFYESLKDFIVFLKDMVVGVGSFIFDGDYRKNVTGKAGEYYDSIKNYIAIEYAKEFDRTGSKAKAMANVGGHFTSLVFKKIGQAVEKSYDQLGCYTQSKRQELMCKAVGSFIVPPAVALGLVFKGPALASKLLEKSRKVIESKRVSTNEPERLSLAKRNDEILRKELELVDDSEIGSPEFNGMVSSLVHTMNKEGGVGISANQVGIDKKLTIVKSGEKGTIALINPEIKKLSEKTTLSLEGCLSIKGECGIIKRDAEIEVTYSDIDGNVQVWQPKGFDRKVVQHEVDHLNGKLWIYHQSGFSKKFAIKPVSYLASDKKVDFHRYLDGLSIDEKKQLKGISKGLNISLQSLKDKSILSKVDDLSVEQKFDKVINIAKLFIHKVPIEDSIKKLDKLIDTDLDALVVYEILKNINNREAHQLISRLRDAKKIDVVDTFKARGPPYKKPLRLEIKKSGTNEIVSVDTNSIEESIKLSTFIEENRLRYIPAEKVFRFKVPEGNDYVSIDVKDATKAFILLDKLKSSQVKNYSDIDFDIYGSRYFVEGNKERPISFGIESEMNFVENPKLLDDYKIIGYSDESWNALSLTDRLEEAKKAQKKMGFKKPFLEKLPNTDERLPKVIINEGDGNIELNGLVFDDISETRAFVNFIDERYGKSSLQGHVVRDKNTQFVGGSGYTVFNADYAQISGLSRNFDIYVDDKSFTPAKNLTHHSLGPLSDRNLKVYKFNERSVNKRKTASSIEGNDARVVYAPVMRTEPYPSGLAGFELRQYHKRGKELLSDMDGLARDLQRRDGLKKYDDYSTLELINSKLPHSRAKELGLVLSNGWKPSLSSSNTYLNALGSRMRSKFPNLKYGGAEVGERFYFPLRDWKNYPAIKNLKGQEKELAISRIENATKEYLILLDNKIKGWKGQSVTNSDLKEVQIAAAKWGKNSGLTEIMEKEKKRLNSDVAPIIPDYVEKIHSNNLQNLKNVNEAVDKLDITEKVFPSGVSYKEIKVTESLKPTNPNYQQFLRNSVEVLYFPAMPYGHINFRVGDRLYSFDYINKTKRADFKPTRGSGKVGFAYSIPKEKIEKIQKELERFYSDSKEFNIAPFDAHSYKLKVKESGDGEVKFKSPGLLFANNKKANANIVEIEDGKFVLETPSGGRYPLEQKSNGEFCTQSLSCSTSAIYLLEKHFGVKNEFNHGAKSLRDAMLKGNPKGTPPDLIIHY